MSAKMKVVFLSYSHDSPAHRLQVLRLSERLRADGLETRLDQYVNGTPINGWPRWMLDQLDQADWVVVVCTETYYRRFRGHDEPRKGSGVDWEGALITQEIYAARSRTEKFVPVLFDADAERFIPEPLRSHTHYELTSEAQYQEFYDALLEQSGVEPGAIGSPKARPRRTGEPLAFSSTNVKPATGTASRVREGSAPPSSTALSSWQKRLDYFLTAQANVADIEQKFRLSVLIAEAREKIQEHGGEA